MEPRPFWAASRDAHTNVRRRCSEEEAGVWGPCLLTRGWWSGHAPRQAPMLMRRLRVRSRRPLSTVPRALGFGPGDTPMTRRTQAVSELARESAQRTLPASRAATGRAEAPTVDAAIGRGGLDEFVGEHGLLPPGPPAYAAQQGLRASQGRRPSLARSGTEGYKKAAVGTCLWQVVRIVARSILATTGSPSPVSSSASSSSLPWWRLSSTSSSDSIRFRRPASRARRATMPELRADVGVVD